MCLASIEVYNVQWLDGALQLRAPEPRVHIEIDIRN